ncbi:nitronate monooxygenase [Puniceicoccaceae bacterium K14]|nr:nitronate monooxygenase [Puniceicoccaceae bacterium K14]
MWKDSVVASRLGIAWPIIQGPFGGGLSTVRLTTAVSNKGGLGSFGAHMLKPSEIEELVGSIRSKTSNPFAINLWVDDSDSEMSRLTRDAFEMRRADYSHLYEKLGVTPPAFLEEPGNGFESQIEAVLESRPDVLSFVFGIPSKSILETCRERGITTIGAATTVEEALAIEAAGVDMVLATGFEAGGHRPSFIDRSDESLMGTVALIPLVRDALKIPVIAAGGIGDGRGLSAAFSLGADAVQLGSAFLACEESGASELHRGKLLAKEHERTVLSRAFSGRLARFLPNGFIKEFDEQGKEALPYPAQSWLVSALKKGALETGNEDYMALYSSQVAPILKHRNVDNLMDELIASME